MQTLQVHCSWFRGPVQKHWRYSTWTCSPISRHSFLLRVIHNTFSITSALKYLKSVTKYYQLLKADHSKAQEHTDSCWQKRKHSIKRTTLLLYFTITWVVPEACAGCLQTCSIFLRDDTGYCGKTHYLLIPTS